MPPDHAAHPDADALDFDEAWYLRQYPGAARAVEQGKVPSGFAHYLRRGRADGKHPNARAARAARPPARLPAGHETYQGAEQDVDATLVEQFPHHNATGFLIPTALRVTTTIPARVALVGACLMSGWRTRGCHPPEMTVDHILVNNADDLPEGLALPAPPTAYDLMVTQVALRSLCPPAMFSSLGDPSGDDAEVIFQTACEELERQIASRMRWNTEHGLLTFVTNYMQPQRNPLGVLFPRHDLTNPEYFIDRLNEVLERLVRGYPNAYVLDMDRLAASVGRRYVQDDVVEQFSHGSMVGLPGIRTNRIEPMAPMVSHFDLRPRRPFLEVIWAEVIGMYRIVRQADAVKLVVVDLDDTLWNGVSGDTEDIGPDMAEGWPLGLAEALRYLKRRGILLAVMSKNEESRIRAIFDEIMTGHLMLTDFAAVVVNWDPKPRNMQGLLERMNLLARNVVFIDDNPAERAAMAAAFPDMRVIGRHPYYLRSTLLWSTETQVPEITTESSRRTEMMHAQLQREDDRKQQSREAFLVSAQPVVRMFTISDTTHPRFGRAFELINKTNQYNTTGRRWAREGLARRMQQGAVLHCFEVRDRYTAYGLVGVVIVSGNNIVQWVMSCRILGYQIEEAVMAHIVRSIRQDRPLAVMAKLVETDVNFPCRGLFAACGFEQTDDTWRLRAHLSVTAPPHVVLDDSSTD